LIDAVSDPVLKHFIEPGDIETVIVDLGGGAQSQVQALSGKSVKRVVQKLLAAAKQGGVDLLNWICSPEEFDLCGKLKTTSIGKVMRLLDEFLKKKWTAATTTTLGTIKAFSILALPGALFQFLAVFASLGFANRVFVELCRCPPVA
jgi:hypothetical protein